MQKDYADYLLDFYLGDEIIPEQEDFDENMFELDLTQGELDILIGDVKEQVVASENYDKYHQELYKGLLNKLIEAKKNI